MTAESVSPKVRSNNHPFEDMKLIPRKDCNPSEYDKKMKLTALLKEFDT